MIDIRHYSLIISRLLPRIDVSVTYRDGLRAPVLGTYNPGKSDKAKTDGMLALDGINTTLRIQSIYRSIVQLVALLHTVDLFLNFTSTIIYKNILSQMMLHAFLRNILNKYACDIYLSLISIHFVNQLC